MSSISKSLLISFAEKYTALIAAFGSTIILARLLTPEEIGVFSVAAVLVGMAHMLRDFGVSQYIVQERELTPQKMRSALGAAILFAWGIALVLLVVAQPVAEFYDDERVETVIFVLSINFFLLPFGSVTLAMMRREFQFGPIYRVQTASALAHAGTGIALAMMGYGFLSLAWSAVVGVLVTVIGLQVYRPKELPYLPGCSEFKSIFSFGGFASIAKISKEARSAAPDMVIGKLIDMEAVGIFGRAMGLIKLFEMAVLTAVKPVMLPLLSADQRAERDMYASYHKIVDYVIALAWPFYGVMYVLAFPLMRVLYGSQWDEAVPIAKILCGFGAISAVYYYLDELLIAMGAVSKMATFHIQLLFIVVPVVIFVGYYGLLSIAYTLVVASIVAAILAYRIVESEVRMDWVSVTKSMGQSIGILLFSVTGPLVVVSRLGGDNENYLLVLLVGALTAMIGWIIGVIVVKHPVQRVFYKLLSISTGFLKRK
ncbi:oligosaccharide flippase family protein [Beggiatoa alba]|nr:oligosaccharide flippase family protein [Beggiatoa alba]